MKTKSAGEHVTKLVPKLSPVEECVDVPKVFTFSIQIIFSPIFTELKWVNFVQIILTFFCRCRRSAQRRRWTLEQFRSQSPRSGATFPQKSLALLKIGFSTFAWWQKALRFASCSWNNQAISVLHCRENMLAWILFLSWFWLWFLPCIVPHCSRCTCYCFEIDNLKLP